MPPSESAAYSQENVCLYPLVILT